MGEKFNISKNHRLRFFTFLGLLLILPTILMVALRLDKEEVLIVEEKELNETADVVHMDDSLIIPLVYENISVLDSLEGQELKEKFVDVLLPSILIAKYRIDEKRKKLLRLKKKKRWHKQDSAFYKELAEAYKASSADELLDKMVTHPNSIILAQAAIESGWGRSRFCKDANNLFGVWSYDKDEPRIKASFTRGDRPIFLRKYDNLSQSIEDYFKILARSGSYKKFRESRKDGDDPFEMVNHLIYYSELRGNYVNMVKRIMAQNDLTKYDHYKIDPEYIVVERKFQ